MSKIYIPEGYVSKLGLYDTQKAISLTKRIFEDSLAGELALRRVSAPLFVTEESGLNDNLNGTERPVAFDLKESGVSAQIVHSLAKWKRMALAKYGFKVGTGLYTDMNAIRRDEDLDNIHSIYVDQWDWELVITESQRNSEFLKDLAQRIVSCICQTQKVLMSIYPLLEGELCEEMKFLTSEELLQMYPGKTPKEREYLAAKEFRTVFISQIGGKLSDGTMHDGRAPDYDDWSLNGDIIFFNEVLDAPLEISSMGIRVNKESLLSQLKERGRADWASKPFHRSLIEGELPLTVGGGIGQSRLCMLIMNKAHIGEVQSSVWDEETCRICEQRGIELL